MCEVSCCLMMKTPEIYKLVGKEGLINPVCATCSAQKQLVNIPKHLTAEKPNICLRRRLILDLSWWTERFRSITLISNLSLTCRLWRCTSSPRGSRTCHRWLCCSAGSTRCYRSASICRHPWPRRSPPSQGSASDTMTGWPEFGHPRLEYQDSVDKKKNVKNGHIR